MINSSIIHAAHELLQSTGAQRHEDSRSIKISFDILESLQHRFPGVGDIIEILKAAIQYTQQQTDLLRVTQASAPSPQVDTIVTKDKRSQTILFEAVIVAKAMSFIDRAYFKCGLSEWTPDQSPEDLQPDHLWFESEKLSEELFQ